MLSHKIMLLAMLATLVLSSTPIIPAEAPAKELDPSKVQDLASSSEDSSNPILQDLAKQYQNKTISNEEFTMKVLDESKTGDALTGLAEEEAKKASLNFHKDLQIRLWDNYYSDPQKMHGLRTYRRDCFRYPPRPKN
jgi:hypothetical protein